MAFFDWDDRMGVGIEGIDEQHRKFVDLINTVADQVEAGMDSVEFAAALKELHDYTMLHFATEQRLMDYQTYPEYFAHLDQHLNCSTKVLAFYQEYINARTVSAHEFLEFMVSWFRGHTMNMDQTLGAYLKRKKSALF